MKSFAVAANTFSSSYHLLFHFVNCFDLDRSWFSSYLLGRQQTTQIGANNTSKKQTILSGAPQGSVLGPLLFLIYINDISNSMGDRYHQKYKNFNRFKQNRIVFLLIVYKIAHSISK